jgi:hypothetical protein
VVVRRDVHGGEAAVKEMDAGRREDGRGDELWLLAESMAQKPRKDGSVDEMSLESRRRAIAYGRARGNA